MQSYTPTYICLFDAFQLPISTNNPVDEASSDKVNLDDVNLIDIPHLPVNHRLPISGIEVIVRCMRRDEIRLFYDVQKIVVRSNAGYGYDELPSFSYFVKYYLDNCCNVVYEMTPTPRKSASSTDDDGHDRIIAFSNFGASQFARDNCSIHSAGNFIALPKHRGKRLAAELMTVHFGLGVDMGYPGAFTETAATNVAVLRNMTALGNIVTGTVPKGIFFLDQGWVDLVTLHVPPGHIPPFKQQLLSAKM